MGSLRSLWKSKTRVNIRSRFELLREAISGTMSNFYMARDRQSGEIVGLKILDREKTAALEGRFQGLNKPKEGDIALLLRHPQIVKTLEHGLTTDGEQFIVMEFLEGPGLNSLIVSRSTLLNSRRVNLIRQGAQALAAVHKAGYIHRDICPRNFVVSRDGNSLKLIDFGLSVPATPTFMQPGIRTGTANYMAPEVVRRRPTSQKLDVFAFGVTAYEVCAFELPWPRGTSGLAAMAHGVEEPIDIFRHCPKLNPQLAGALLTCLEPTPEKRPTMDEFLEMIEGVEREEEPG